MFVKQITERMRMKGGMMTIIKNDTKMNEEEKNPFQPQSEKKLLNGMNEQELNSSINKSKMNEEENERDENNFFRLQIK
jgi:carbamoylphosphate synthase small subunit